MNGNGASVCLSVCLCMCVCVCLCLCARTHTVKPVCYLISFSLLTEKIHSMTISPKCSRETRNRWSIYLKAWHSSNSIPLPLVSVSRASSIQATINVTPSSNIITRHMIVINKRSVWIWDIGLVSAKIKKIIFKYLKIKKKNIMKYHKKNSIEWNCVK